MGLMKVGRLSLAGIAALAAISLGCGSKPAQPVISPCHHDSECATNLVCALGYCVNVCQTSRDCPNSERCVVVGGTDGGTARTAPDGGQPLGATACEAPQAVSCRYTTDCTAPLVCGSDDQCRNECESDRDCPGGDTGIEVCTAMTHLCADPALDKDYDPTIKDFRFDAGTSNRDAGNSTDGAAGDRPMRDGSGDAVIPPPSCAAGVAGFHPSNVPLSLSLPSNLPATKLSGTATFDTDALTVSGSVDAGQWNTMIVTMSGGYEAAVALFDTFTLANGATLQITGMRPLILIANGALEIDGTIIGVRSVSNGWYGGGPPAPSTAMRAGLCALNVLAGGGGAANGSEMGAGGGGYCGKGGAGSALPDGGTSSPGGTPYGTATLIPLAGGASGGSSNGSDITNHGGGAIELVSGSLLTIGDTGIINLGGGGTDPGYGVGGGSGGGILLESPAVVVRGILAVNGGSGSAAGNGGSQPGQPSLQPAAGGGGVAGNGSVGTGINGGDAVLQSVLAGGGGGAGRIRINTGCGGSFEPSSGAIISPTSATACFTTGPLS